MFAEPGEGTATIEKFDYRTVFTYGFEQRACNRDSLTFTTGWR